MDRHDTYDLSRESSEDKGRAKKAPRGAGPRSSCEGGSRACLVEARRAGAVPTYPLRYGARHWGQGTKEGDQLGTTPGGRPKIAPSSIHVLTYHRHENGQGATMRRLILTTALFVGLAVPA